MGWYLGGMFSGISFAQFASTNLKASKPESGRSIIRVCQTHWNILQDDATVCVVKKSISAKSTQVVKRSTLRWICGGQKHLGDLHNVRGYVCFVMLRDEPVGLHQYSERRVEFNVYALISKRKWKHYGPWFCVSEVVQYVFILFVLFHNVSK